MSPEKDRIEENPGEIIQRAEDRARRSGIAFRGLLTPAEAWDLSQQLPSASLLDVRTREELIFVGRVPGAVEIEWRLFPEMAPNPRFLTDVRNRFDVSDFLLLLCRSGVRSHEAAELLTEEGFGNCFNVMEGFEGDKDANGQRVVDGWKVRGLPWSQ